MLRGKVGRVVKSSNGKTSCDEWEESMESNAVKKRNNPQMLEL
jgi:hypothetical protein